MKAISISKNKFNSLQPLNLEKEILNTEGKIYEFIYRNQEKVLKTLYNSNGPRFANKLYTVEMLDSFKEYLPQNFCIPDYLVSVSDHVIGYTMPKLEGVNLTTVLNHIAIDNKEKIFYLKTVGGILEQLHNIRKYTPLTDIYINDLHDSNFIINPNNREVGVIDLDSSKIGANYAFPSRFMTKKSLASYLPNKYITNEYYHADGHVVANEDSDLYCYIIMILNFLYRGNVHTLAISEFYEYINYLSYIGVNKELLDMFCKIVNTCGNVNPMNYLEYLTDEQIGRASHKVYTLARKK